MFSPATEHALAAHFQHENGIGGLVVLPADVYRELVAAARQWDAMRSGPSNHGATVRLVTNPDGSLSIEA